MATPVELRIGVVQDLQKWALFFCNYATYTELFGRPTGGMVPLEVTESHLAYEEYERYRDARKAWDDEHQGAGPDEQFSAEGYIRDRIYCIENDLEDLPIDPL